MTWKYFILNFTKWLTYSMSLKKVLNLTSFWNYYKYLRSKHNKFVIQLGFKRFGKLFFFFKESCCQATPWPLRPLQLPSNLQHTCHFYLISEESCCLTALYFLSKNNKLDVFQSGFNFHWFSECMLSECFLFYSNYFKVQLFKCRLE